MKRSIWWFRLWLLFHRPALPLCGRCRESRRGYHRPCFEVFCTCRCSRLEGYQP